MKIQYLGTAAAEGVPALFCHCPVCEKSRRNGGRNIRTRSQILINEDLLIDFSADTYLHVLRDGIDLCKVKDCLITHTHSDHFYPEDIKMIFPGFSTLPDEHLLSFHGSRTVTEEMEKKVLTAHARYLAVHTLEAFLTYDIGAYQVTPLPALHDPSSGPFIYLISDGKDTVLFANDTAYFRPETWDFLIEKKPRLTLASLDCTECRLPTYPNDVWHMNFETNLKVRERLVSIGCADENTTFICHHFSHNGGEAAYDDFAPYAAKFGFLVSYDRMTVEL